MAHPHGIGTFVVAAMTTVLAALLPLVVDVVDETETGVVIDMTVGGGAGQDRHLVEAEDDTEAQALGERSLTTYRCLADRPTKYQMCKSLL